MKPFALGSFRRSNGRCFVGIVVGNRCLALDEVYKSFLIQVTNKARLENADSVLGLLKNWNRNFSALTEIVEFAAHNHLFEEATKIHPDSRDLSVLPPINRPSKMIYAGANYRKHVAELRASGFSKAGAQSGNDAFDDKEKLEPYCWLKAPSTLTGAYDNILLPNEDWDIDWEIELAFAIGEPAKRVSAENATDHIAGYMTTNDISCRTLTFRDDRPVMGTDWLGGKSLDTFAPMGPFFVPRAFVKDHNNLNLKMKLNGEVMQDANTGDMIFTPDEQVEYVSRFLTLEPGDVFATGSPEGNGQSRGFFLKEGDVIESEVQGLGAMRNEVSKDK